jgi:hypothetical protein
VIFSEADIEKVACAVAVAVSGDKETLINVAVTLSEMLIDGVAV